MKHLRHVCAATILALIISVSAFAGEMDTPGSTHPAPPPPPPPPITAEMDTPGRLANTSSSESAYDALTEAARLFCQNVLSVF